LRLLDPFGVVNETVTMVDDVMNPKPTFLYPKPKPFIDRLIDRLEKSSIQRIPILGNFIINVLYAIRKILNLAQFARKILKMFGLIKG
jgi:hypothetical protein